MNDFPSIQGQTLIYRPRRLGAWSLVLFLIAGVFLVSHPLATVARGSVTMLTAPLWSHLLLGAAALAYCGFIVISRLRGLPRLSVTASGIQLDTAFGSTAANWDSLALFEVTSTAVSWFRRPVQSLRARIIGLRVSQSLRDKTSFTIPDAFQEPIATIAMELNARHPRALDAGAALQQSREMLDENRFGARFKLPWLTLAILDVLIAVFVAEQIFAVVPPGPLLRVNLFTMYAMGGLNRFTVLQSGEWYRLLTAPMLHADLLHLFFNGIALLMAGFILEGLVGRAWFLALYVTGAVGGSLMSLAVNPPGLTSVGASGAIMAMLASAFVPSFRLPHGPARTRAQMTSLRILIPSMLPLASSAANAVHVDYGAHLGGILTGGAMSLLLLCTWPETNRLPRFRVAAGATAAIGLLSLVAGSAGVANHYGKYQELAWLIPQKDLPKTAAEIEQHGLDLAARYPRDPRAHMYAGYAHLKAHDNAAAEREFRLSLSTLAELQIPLGPKLNATVHASLAATLQEEGRPQEAREMAEPACQAAADEQPAEALMKLLRNNHLCD